MVKDRLGENARVNPTSQVGAFLRSGIAQSPAHDDHWNGAYSKFSFSANSELDNCDILRSEEKTPGKNFWISV